jgi:ATP-dependent RNA helicase SUPV3L1/SUV3
MWRNSDLDFRSIPAACCAAWTRRRRSCLRCAREADDHQLALRTLSHDAGIVKKREGPKAAVRLLWDVCQVPDFRKVMSDQHTACWRRSSCI